MADSAVPFIMVSGFIGFVSVGWYVNTYNKFIKYKNRIDTTWTSIDVALKRRLNLIPNLLELLKEHAGAEAEELARVNTMMGKKGESNRLQDESSLSRSLVRILALAQTDPHLRASATLLPLQESLNEIEAEIQRARNLYNAEVGRLNTLIESFPSKYIAQHHNFTKLKYFSLELATKGQLSDDPSK